MEALQELVGRCCESRSVETGGTERPAGETFTLHPGSWPPLGGSHPCLVTVPWVSRPHPRLQILPQPLLLRLLKQFVTS